MHVSIKDISNACGVSMSTVSRALNGHQDINKETCEKVLLTAKQLNYIPNNSARNLAMQSQKCIALVVRGVGNPFFAEVIRPLERYFQKLGYSTFLHQIDSVDNEIEEAAKVVYEKRLCGIVFLGGQYNYTESDLDLLRVPFVFVTYTNYFGSLTKDSYSSVSIDDVREAYRAVDYLIQRNHRKIGIVVPHHDDHSVSQLRLEGYRKALQEHDLLDPSLIQVSDSFSMKKNYQAATKLLQQHQFDAIFAISDAIAIAAMKAASDLGLSVPKDLSILGFDGIEMSQYCIPTLTTFQQPVEDIVQNSAQILLDLMENKGHHRQLLLETNILTGGSVLPR